MAQTVASVSTAELTSDRRYHSRSMVNRWRFSVMAWAASASTSTPLRLSIASPILPEIVFFRSRYALRYRSRSAKRSSTVIGPQIDSSCNSSADSTCPRAALPYRSASFCRHVAAERFISVNSTACCAILSVASMLVKVDQPKSRRSVLIFPSMRLSVPRMRNLRNRFVSARTASAKSCRCWIRWPMSTSELMVEALSRIPSTSSSTLVFCFLSIWRTPSSVSLGSLPCSRIRSANRLRVLRAVIAVPRALPGDIYAENTWLAT